MNEATSPTADAFLSPHPVPRERARVKVFVDYASTFAGVATLIALGIAIRAAGEAAGLKNDACWQLTGARAAASTAVLGTLITLRRGQLALFGALYGAWLLVTHPDFALVGSAVLAGVGAWVGAMLLRERGTIVRMLGATLAFNVLLTVSSLLKALKHDPISHITMTSWSQGVGLRALATVIVVGVFALFTRPRPAAE